MTRQGMPAQGQKLKVTLHGHFKVTTSAELPVSVIGRGWIVADRNSILDPEFSGKWVEGMV